MKNSNTKAWEVFLSAERTPLYRYGFAVLISLCSLFLVSLFHNLEEGASFSSFAVLTVILSAIYGGKGPAFLDTLITSIGLDYLVFAPYFRVFDSPSSVVRITIYMIVGYLVSTLVESLKESFIELKAQKDAIEIEKRARENVLGVVSHDLRSPLSSIIMNADLLLRKIDPNSTQKRSLEGIRNSASRMNLQIEDLLDAVKVEAGQFKIETSRTSLKNIIETAVRDSTSSALQKDIRITFSLSSGDDELKCDPLRIIQVLNNLIGNAIKFSPSDSEVNVSLECNPQTLVIKIKDYGPGISKEDQELLFLKYWQARGTAHKGTGLGLFISKSIISLHNGEIKVQSKIGEGSTFIISLPKNL